MKKKAYLALIFTSILAFSGLFFACSAVVSVEFDTKGGSEIKRQLLSYGSFALRPEESVRLGYTFENWYADKEYNSLFDFENTKITKDTIVYAKWILNSYTINFVTLGTTVPAVTFYYGTPLEPLVESYRTGYRFTGWFIDAACTAKFESETMPAEDIALYAGWQFDPGYSAFTFAKNEKGYTLVSVEDIRLSVLPVPETYNNLPVNRVGKFAFEFAKRISEIELSDNIETIEESAFEGCFALRCVRLPDLAVLSPRLFYGCTALESVNLSDSLTLIGAAAFYGCSSLSDIVMPESLAVIGERAFYGCVSLGVISADPASEAEFIIPDSVNEIGDRAFSGCKFTSIKIPNGLKGLGSNVFYNCVKLESVDFGMGIKSIGSGSFENCTALSSINLPVSVNRIDSRAFAFTGLKSLILPSGVNEVGDYLFFGCNELAKAEMPYLLHIGNYMFLNCAKLTEVEFSQSLLSIGDGAFESCTALKNPVFPAGLEKIGISAFKNCSIDEVDLSCGISEISKSAFENCRALKRVVLPSGLLKISDYAFSGCFLLSDISLPALLVEIGYKAFAGCSNISEFNFSDNLLFIGGYAFESTDWLGALGTGNVYAGKVLYLYRGDSNIRTDTLAIAGEAFLGNNNLISIEIPENIEVIGDYAFKGCTQLTNLTLSALIVGKGAFYGCTSLVEVNLGQRLMTVSDDMFNGCVSFSEITLPDSVSEIGARAFYGCEGLESVSFGRYSILNAIRLSAFELCKNLKEIEIPDSLTEIGARAFYGCGKLRRVNFGTESKLDIIRSSAYEFCKSLEEIELPDSLTEILSFAFKETSLRKLIIGSGIKHIPEQIVSTVALAGVETNGTTEAQRSLTVIVKSRLSIGLSSFLAGAWLKIILPHDFYSELKSGDILAGDENWAVYLNYIFSDDSLHGDWLIENDCLITYVGSGAVAKGIKIPDGVTEIAPYAFSGMDFINSVEFNAALVKIGQYAFYATSIIKIKLHEGIKNIGTKAFWVKSYLYRVDVDINAVVDSHVPASIGANAFKIKGYYSVLGEGTIFYKFDGDDKVYGTDGKVLTDVEDSVLIALGKVSLHKKIIFLKNAELLQLYKQSWIAYSEYLAEQN